VSTFEKEISLWEYRFAVKNSKELAKTNSTCVLVSDDVRAYEREYSSHVTEIKIFETNPKIWVEIAWVAEGASM
jgi:hypothetical protein